MFRKTLFTFLLVSILCFSSQAQSKNLKSVLLQLNIKEADCFEELVVEKVIPYAQETSVLVLPRIVEQDEEGNMTFDSYILIINNKSGKIINKFFEKKAWFSDAVRLDAIGLDFAPYKLNESTRAFGVRLSYSGSSRPNPYSETLLSLFIPSGDSLLRVLKDCSMSSYHGDWDTNCNGNFTSEENVLILSENKNNGFKDLIVKSTITNITNIPVKDDCKEEKKVEKPVFKVLKYSNNEYR